MDNSPPAQHNAQRIADSKIAELGLSLPQSECLDRAVLQAVADDLGRAVRALTPGNATPEPSGSPAIDCLRDLLVLGSIALSRGLIDFPRLDGRMVPGPTHEITRGLLMATLLLDRQQHDLIRDVVMQVARGRLSLDAMLRWSAQATRRAFALIGQDDEPSHPTANSPTDHPATTASAQGSRVLRALAALGGEGCEQATPPALGARGTEFTAAMTGQQESVP